MWCQDEAGPYRTIPHPGQAWREEGNPRRYPHEYHPNGPAKVMTLLHPRSGRVRVKGVPSVTNAVLHPWLKAELGSILATLPVPAKRSAAEIRAQWESWQEGLTLGRPLPAELPPLRLVLVLDNLTGHKSNEWVAWCYAHGILLLFTPLGGSWLNMAESIQNVLKDRALRGTHPTEPQQIMDRFEAVARHWNELPTPLIWGGKRQERRRRARERRRLAASGACVEQPLRRAA